MSNYFLKITMITVNNCEVYLDSEMNVYDLILGIRL